MLTEGVFRIPVMFHSNLAIQLVKMSVNGCLSLYLALLGR